LRTVRPVVEFAIAARRRLLSGWVQLTLTRPQAVKWPLQL